jgi:putative inorganic carbon (HCO3(-)) transporter
VSSAIAVARQRLGLLVLGSFPVLAFVALRLLGYWKLARLGAIGLAAVAGAGVLFLRPRWGLYLLLIYIYSGVGLFLPFNLASPTITIVLAAVLLDWVRGERPILPDAYFWSAVAVFTLIALFSMLFARDIGASMRDLGSFGKMLLIVILVTHLIRTPEQLRGMCYAVFIGAVATVVLGVLGIVLGLEGAGENYIGGVNIMRFTGAHENPNKAAAHMCSALPLGLFAARNCTSRLARIGATVGSVVLVVAIFATFSRSAIIPLTIILIAVAVFELRSRRSLFSIVGLVTIGVLLAPRYYWDRVMTLPGALKTATLDWSVYTRMLALQTGWEMFLNHPVTGVGLGNFMGSSAYRLFVRIVVHNTYLEILVGTGVAGLAAFIAILAGGLRHAVAGARRRWNAHPAWMRSLSFYVMLSALSIGLSAGFATVSFRYVLWVPVAAGLVIGNLLRTEKGA